MRTTVTPPQSNTRTKGCKVFGFGMRPGGKSRRNHDSFENNRDLFASPQRNALRRSLADSDDISDAVTVAERQANGGLAPSAVDFGANAGDKVAAARERGAKVDDFRGPSAC